MNTIARAYHEVPPSTPLTRGVAGTVLAGLAVALTASLAWAQVDGSHLTFSGTELGWIEAAHHPALNPTTAITVEAWVNLRDYRAVGGGNCPGLAGKGYQTAWWLGVCDGQVRFYSRGSGSALTGPTHLPLTTWTHVAATSDGTTVRLYVNGAIDAESTLSAAGPLTTNSLPMRIGADANWEQSPEGSIDEVRIWNVVRTQAQIAAARSTAITTPQAGLVAVWGMTSPNATVGGFAGTLHGSASLSGNPCAHEVFVPTAGHLPGIGGSQWRTDLALFNPGTAHADVVLSLLPRDRDNSTATSVVRLVNAGTVSTLPDVVLAQFSQNNTAAALRLCSTAPIRVASRTYNQAATGTYGQGIPGFRAAQAIAAGTTVHLFGLSQDDHTRTNLGFVNVTTAAVSVRVEYFNASGTSLGLRTYPIPPRGHIQRTQAFNEVAGTVSGGRVEITPTGGAIFAYASVIDSATGDGSFFAAE